MKQYLFFYGTLLPSMASRELNKTVQRLRWVGRASMPGSLYDLGDFPGAILDANSSGRILGEVHELPNDAGVLAVLDQYEEFDPTDPAGSLFIRVRATATLEDGRKLPCWVYQYNRDPGTAQQIASGDYAAWRASREEKVG
jgi:gamma-glutamylcyclotransferase (GGCT)/AIG2-like uncharacterized protein YtfP